MNIVRFEPTSYREGDTTSGLRIIIDGRDLCEFVREAELPFATQEGHPEIAGNYAGLPPEDVPSKHLLGQPAESYNHDDGRTQVLMCDCGEPGCWPLLCRIAVDETRVRWFDFIQPHRSKSSQIPWQYPHLQFEFERLQYHQALEQLSHTS